MTDITGNSAYITNPPAVESRFSGVSWGAIVAGGIAAAAMALLLMALGAGLGLIAVSPWPDQGASAETVGIGVIVWSIIIEVAAFGLGGYLAGRLRTKWANLHGDEVYFRDTAHGFVTWALGTLVSICLVSGAAGQVARTTAEVGGTVGTAAVAGAGAVAANGPNMAAGARMRGNPMDYYVDLLFRPANAPGAATGGTATTPAPTNITPGTIPMNGQANGEAANDLGPVRAEITHIAAASFKDGTLNLSAPDRSYIAQRIAERTGLSQADAEKRVDDVVGQAKAAFSDMAEKAKQAADAARKTGAALAMWSVIAMLIGAFVASYAATIGGRHRDL
jgi:hypothetical protein